MTLMTATMTALALVGCGQAKENGQAEASAPKCLVLYYSQTGNTQRVAEEFATLLGAEAVSFDVDAPYDGTYQETIERCRQEMESDSLPGLAPLGVDVADYDVIFLGYPIWFGTYARPVMALLEQTDFEGKTIVPFCTFGSGGLESSVSQMRAACPEADIRDGYGVRTARMEKAAAEVRQFLINGGYIEGEKVDAAEYSPQQPVGEQEVAVFDAACGDYPMPIGTPVSVGSRATADGTDYLFTVSAKGRDGEDVEAQVYITCEEGAQPEFTKVVR